MEEELFLKAQAVRKSLERNKDIIELDRLEKALNEHEEVQLLSFLMHRSYDELEYLKETHASEDEIKIKSLEYQEHKKNLYQMALVKEYHLMLNKVRLIYEQINEDIFRSILEDKHKCE